MISFLTLLASQILEWSPEIFRFVVFTPFEKTSLFNDITGNYWQRNNLLDEFLSILAIITGVIYAFSKEKIEDEYVDKIRKDALIISIYVNYAIYILATVLIYDLMFLQVLMLNVFSTLIVFIIIFNWKKYQLKKISNEE
jgi:hypothetical protein